MATLTIRNLPDEVRDRLRVAAAKNGRSMEAEARLALVERFDGESEKLDPETVKQRIRKPKRLSPLIFQKIARSSMSSLPSARKCGAKNSGRMFGRFRFIGRDCLAPLRAVDCRYRELCCVCGIVGRELGRNRKQALRLANARDKTQ